MKKASARQDRSTRGIIEESLELNGVGSTDAATDIVARARAQARLEADEAMAVAVRETRLHRSAD